MRKDDRWLSVSQMPLPDGGRIVLFTDITDFKDAERRAWATVPWPWTSRRTGSP